MVGDIDRTDFEESRSQLVRPKASIGRSRAIEDLTREEMEQLSAARMAPEHDHLNALLDEK